MGATMQAVLKRDQRSGISLEQIQVPQPGPDDVLVRVKATAICGTDLHIAHWSGMAQSMGVRVHISRTPMDEVSRWVLPFFFALVAALLLVTYIPELSLWLPDALGVR